MFKTNTNQRNQVSVVRNLFSMFMILFLVISMMSTIEAGSVEVLDPILNYVSHTHISLLKHDNYEYLVVPSGGVVGSSSWQEGNEFSELMYDTEYDCYQRIKATDYQAASEPSNVLKVRTPALKIAGGYQVMAFTISEYTGSKWFATGLVNAYIVNNEYELRKIEGLKIYSWGTFYIPEDMIFDDDRYIYFDSASSANSVLVTLPTDPDVRRLGAVDLQEASLEGRLIDSSANGVEGVIAMHSGTPSYNPLGIQAEGIITAIETDGNGYYKLAPFFPLEEGGSTVIQLVGIATEERKVSSGNYSREVGLAKVPNQDIECDVDLYTNVNTLPTRTVASSYNDTMHTAMLTEIDSYHNAAVANSLLVRMAEENVAEVVEDHYKLRLHAPGASANEYFSGSVNVYIAGKEIAMISPLEVSNGLVAIPKDLIDSSDRVIYLSTSEYANTKAIDIIQSEDSVVDLGDVYFQEALIEGQINNSLGSLNQAYLGLTFNYNGLNQLFMLKADSSNAYKLAPLADNMGTFEMVGFIAEGLIFAVPTYESFTTNRTLDYNCFMSYGMGDMTPQHKTISQDFLQSVQESE